MKKGLNNFFSILLPNKRINLFSIFIILLGIISGSIFLIVLNNNDKEIVITKIIDFMNIIDSNKINNTLAFKNSLIENCIFVFLVWILGVSIIGVVINMFLVYLRGFILGFSISSFIIAFKYKGIIASFMYAFPTSIINLIITILVSVYSFSFTIMLYRSIFNKTNNLTMRGYIKKYFYILIIGLILSLISSLSEAFLFPSMMKLVIKLFI